MFFNLCWIWSKKTSASNFYKENNFKPCLTKHILNMFKLWCERGIRHFGSMKYITAFASTSSKRNRGSFDSEELRPSKWYQCEIENPVSCRKPRFRERRVWKQVKVVKIPMTKADLFLRIFEAIRLELWNALKPFRMWKHFGNPLEMVRILFENPLWKCRWKKYSPSLRSLSTYWRMRDSTACNNVFFRVEMLFAAWFGTDLFVVERSKDITHMKLLVSGENLGHLRGSEAIWRPFSNGFVFGDRFRRCSVDDSRIRSKTAPQLRFRLKTD